MSNHSLKCDLDFSGELPIVVIPHATIDVPVGFIFNAFLEIVSRNLIFLFSKLSGLDLDLTRILHVSGAPLSIARTITAFHLELLQQSDRSQSRLSSNTLIGLRTSPPIDALISAAIYAQQLLTYQTDNVIDGPILVDEVRELFSNDKESQNVMNFISSTQAHSGWFKALARSLEWLYAGRQVNGEAIKVSI